MPKITIIEKDFTTSGAFLANENVVYIPGFSALTLDGDMIGVPTLCKTVDEFETAFGTAPKDISDLSNAPDKSYIMAHELLKLGMYVLYEVPATPLGGTIAVATSAEMENALKASNFWARLQDRGLYDIRFITSGAYGKESPTVSETTIKEMLVTAGERGDAIALIDHKSSLTTKAKVQTHFETVGALAEVKYGAGFTPWIYIASEFFAEGDDNSVPGSFAYLSAFAQSVRVNPSWLAVAGASRGKIPGLVSPFVTISYGEIEADAFQTRDAGDISVNPICNINPYGFILWGNRTLNPVGAGTTAQTDLVASNFLNIRNLVCSVKKTLFVVSRGLTFEQNSDILWVNFKAGVSPLLDQMLSGNGIADYRLIRKKTDAKATLKAIIRIVPIEAVEDFDLTIEMSDSVEVVTE